MIVGNTVGFEVTLEIMECGVAGVLVGVGPGAACTSRGVLGLGVPQVTATVDCAAARDYHLKSSGRYVPIITDGGMSKGGDVCIVYVSSIEIFTAQVKFQDFWQLPNSPFLRVTRVVSSLNVLNSFWYYDSDSSPLLM